MKPLRASFAATTLAAGLVATGSPLWAQATGSVVVLGNNEDKRTYDCRGGTGVVNGDGNVLIFHNCTQITVNGNKNTIDAGVVTTLTVLGNGNNVTWIEEDGKRPRIVNAGSGNTVSVASGVATAASASAGKTGAPPARAPAASASGSKTTISPGGVTVSNSGSTVDIGPGGVTVSGSRSSSTAGPASSSGSLVLNDNRQHRTHDCAGGAAVINSNENILTLRGCSTITVSGNQNTIDAVAPGTLHVDGNGNTLTWTEGPGGAPRIIDNGSGNKVSRKP
jgi:hypothetical protein